MQDKGAEEYWEGGDRLFIEMVREGYSEKALLEERPDVMREGAMWRWGDIMSQAEATPSMKAQRQEHT